MALNIESGSFKIVSLSTGNLPVGVNYTKPSFQFVYVGAPVRSWKFHKVGHDKYRLSIDGSYPYTGVIDNKVVGSINPEDEVTWKIAFRKFQAAYTIALADDPGRGWTVQDDGKFEIHPITQTHSNPPQFRPIQLFAFEPFEE